MCVRAAVWMGASLESERLGRLARAELLVPHHFPRCKYCTMVIIIRNTFNNNNNNNNNINNNKQITIQTILKYVRGGGAGLCYLAARWSHGFFSLDVRIAHL